jgi:glycosidase
MPVNPIGELRSINSPYCIRDYTAVNEEFGSLDDLRVLVEEAHSRNMAVILDFVPNHTSWDHIWINKNKSWYRQDSIGNIVHPRNWRDVAQLNFSNSDMRQELIKSMKYWILTANIDGFRMDYSDGPPYDFWKQAIDSLRSIPNRKLIMLSEGTRPDHYEAGFDYNFGFRFFSNLHRIYSNNRSVNSIDSLNITDYIGASGAQQIVRYTSNHDVNSSDGTPLELFGGEKGSMAAFVIVSFMKGIPMIYGGQEVGIPYRLTFPFISTKIDWTVNTDLTAEYKSILAIRNNSEAVRRGQLTSYSDADVCVFSKEAGAEKVLVLSNLRNKSVTYSIPLDLVDTSWKDAFTGLDRSLGTNIILDPYSYLILKNR